MVFIAKLIKNPNYVIFTIQKIATIGNFHSRLVSVLLRIGDPPEARTRDNIIKSDVLYQLS